MCRLNMSHGDYSEHQERLDLVRSVAVLNVAALADLGPGPYRPVREDGESGSTSRLVTSSLSPPDDINGQSGARLHHFRVCPRTCKPGDVILIDDGKTVLRLTL